MSEILFEGFPKMSRLSRNVVITEKIDGTNAQIAIVSSMDPVEQAIAARYPEGAFGDYMLAGSRTRWITPNDDNYGFARWAQDHAKELWALGAGRHFGEWWGQGIQRKYGQSTKRFSLFNTQRWCDALDTPREIPTADPRVTRYQEQAPVCCSVVPVLFEGPFETTTVDGMVERLRQEGSMAAPGFMKPEGVVVYHKAQGTLFKKTLEKDKQAKGAPA